MKRIVIIIILLGVIAGGWVWMRTISPSGAPVLTESEVPTSSGLTSVMELANSTWSPGVRWNDVITQKTQEATSSPEALKELAFAQSFVGDFKNAEQTLDTYCQETTEDAACQKIAYVFDIKAPTDNSGKPLSDVTFEVLGKPETVQEFTGDTILSDMTYKNTIVRTKMTKKGYTDFVSTSMHMAWDDSTDSQKSSTLTPIMIPADVRVVKKHTEAYEVKTKNYTFTVQPDTFVYPDGTLATGDIEAYFFDINADTVNAYASGMFSLSVFERVTGEYMGEGMITYGMPLVKAYVGDVELYVKKPIIGVGRMSHLDDFKEKNSLTNIDFAAVPKNTPIDITLAARYNLPPFWQYQKRTGIWETSTFQVLDNTGLTQFSFQDF